LQFAAIKTAVGVFLQHPKEMQQDGLSAAVMDMALPGKLRIPDSGDIHVFWNKALSPYASHRIHNRIFPHSHRDFAKCT